MTCEKLRLIKWVARGRVLIARIVCPVAVSGVEEVGGGSRSQCPGVQVGTRANALRQETGPVDALHVVQFCARGKGFRHRIEREIKDPACI